MRFLLARWQHEILALEYEGIATQLRGEESLTLLHEALDMIQEHARLGR